MFKQLSILEVKAGEDRFHRYECPPNSPLGEVHDCLWAMLSFVAEKIKEGLGKKEKDEKDDGKFKVNIDPKTYSDPLNLRCDKKTECKV